MANTSTIDLVKPAGTDYALISTINGNMDKIDAEAAKVRGNFAGTYDATATYAVGDYCVYSGDLYRCTTAISTAEAWTAAHWVQVAAGDELTTLADDISTLTTNTKELVALHTTGSYNNSGRKINAGEYVYVDGNRFLSADGLYKAKVDINTGSSIQPADVDLVTDGGLNALNDQIEKYSTYGYAEFSDTVTINQYSERVITNINIGKTGYIPIGIAGFDTGSDSFIPEQVFINPSTNYAYVKIKNYDSAAHTATYSFRVMYVKAYSLNNLN